MQGKQRLLIPLLLLTTAIGLVSGIQVFRSDSSLAWFGAFLASASLPAFFALFLAAGGTPRTSPKLLPVQVAAFSGTALTVSEALQSFSGEGPVSLMPLAAAIVGLIVLEWYVFAYSTYGRKKSRSIVLGQPLPDVEFQTLDGNCVSSRDFIGSKTLLVFFRGNWCPLCMAQLREVVKYADELAALSVNVKLISNQSVEKMEELAQRLPLTPHFELLCDSELRAASTLAIEDIGGTPPGLKGFPADTVMATAIALAADGRVLLGDETDNYRVRPHPESFLHVFSDGSETSGHA